MHDLEIQAEMLRSIAPARVADVTPQDGLQISCRAVGAPHFHVKFKRYSTDFAELPRGWLRPTGVGYRFCLVGRAIGSGWQGPPNFREWGGPTQGKSFRQKEQDPDGLACLSLVTGTAFDWATHSITENRNPDRLRLLSPSAWKRNR